VFLSGLKKIVNEAFVSTNGSARLEIFGTFIGNNLVPYHLRHYNKLPPGYVVSRNMTYPH
jgi:hypothetical protein